MTDLFVIPETPRLGDIVMVKQGIGVVRYVGSVEFDKEHTYYGVEVKGPPVIGGHSGAYGKTQYFQTSKPQRGIFCKQVIRVVSSEEILNKVMELHTVVKNNYFNGSKDVNSNNNMEYNELLLKVNNLQDELKIYKDALSNKMTETANAQQQYNLASNIYRERTGNRLSMDLRDKYKINEEADENENENGYEKTISKIKKSKTKNENDEENVLSRQRHNTEVSTREERDDAEIDRLNGYHNNAYSRTNIRIGAVNYGSYEPPKLPEGAEGPAYGAYGAYGDSSDKRRDSVDKGDIKVKSGHKKTVSELEIEREFKTDDAEDWAMINKNSGKNENDTNDTNDANDANDASNANDSRTRGIGKDQDKTQSVVFDEQGRVVGMQSDGAKHERGDSIASAASARSLASDHWLNSVD